MRDVCNIEKKSYLCRPKVLVKDKEVRWVSGLNHQFAKLTYGKLYRGFESLPHRRKNNYTGCSSVRLECLVWDQEVVGSNPAIPTNIKKSISNDRLFFMPKLLILFIVWQITIHFQINLFLIIGIHLKDTWYTFGIPIWIPNFHC